MSYVRLPQGFESLCAEVADSTLGGGWPDPAGWASAASDHADEADQPVREEAVAGSNRRCWPRAAGESCGRTAGCGPTPR